MRVGQGREDPGLESHVGGFLTYLGTTRGASPSTVQGYATDLAQFFAFLRLRPGVEPDHNAVRRFLDEGRTQGQSSQTAARKLSALRSFFRYLCREGVVDENPAAIAAGPRLRQRPPRYLHLTEVKKLLELPDRSPQGLRDRAVLEVLYATGLRLGQLHRLNIEDVDAEGEFLRLVERGREERCFSCGAPTRSTLRDYLRLARPGFLRALDTSATKEHKDGSPSRTRALFLNRRGGRLSPRGVRRLLDRYLTELAAALGTSPADLRLTLATRLLSAGADALAVREMLGQASLLTGQTVACVSQARLRAVYLIAHPRAWKEGQADAQGDNDSGG